MFTFNKNYFIVCLILFCIEVAIAVFLKDGFIRFTVGDFLVVALLYYFIKSFITLKPLSVAIIVLVIAFIIEGLQLVNILDTLNLRGNKTASIVLGSHFSIGDLLAYALGTICTLYLDLNVKREVEA